MWVLWESHVNLFIRRVLESLVNFFPLSSIPVLVIAKSARPRKSPLVRRHRIHLNIFLHFCPRLSLPTSAAYVCTDKVLMLIPAADAGAKLLVVDDYQAALC